MEILPMPTDKHQTILKFPFLAFFRFFEAAGGNVMFAPLRLRVRPRKFREPGLLLVLSATDPRRQNRFWSGADLALEVVSEDKPERDLIDKRGDYAEAGVREYWIVNPLTEPLRFYACAAMPMKKQAPFVVANQPCRPCNRRFRFRWMPCSTLGKAAELSGW